ncbi:SURF1 family protein [Rhodobacter sp. KR11]|uniref:SURF1 family protein n=1 Tax=Rhodobacter sp. KR11 TaxID=2974588 RepID=UPI0022238EB4|nr:SURF1 family protein [Rhodobacter sp. KR11]MCW1920141.1 SURF1 family protein [Rhodobacter sp. KR11]
MRRVIGPLVFGVVGVAILVSLGTWQLQRLALKEAKIAEIEAMIGAAAVALPAVVGPGDRYRAVTVAGVLTGEAVYKLDSLRGQGPGRRVIAVLETEGRRVMVDLGILPEGDTVTLAGRISLTGNLDMPQETDSYTPAPDGDLWFARDVPAMAATLKAEPTLIVAGGPVVDGIVAVPVDTSSIPNDHWNYALTWFSLALVWFVMTLAWMWRIRRQNQRAG